MLKGIGATLAVPLLDAMRPFNAVAGETTQHPVRK
jgi:hypothetical protein